MRQCFTCPLHRQEHLYKVTGSNELGLGVLLHSGQMARNRQFVRSIYVASLIRAWMKAGSREATTEIKSHTTVFNN